MANSAPWAKIFKDYKIDSHDFDEAPFFITNKEIKKSVQDFKTTGEKEVRILCKQDRREDRPEVFKERGLFLLPVKNGNFAIVKGEGYVDIPEISSEPIEYSSKLDFELETSQIGDSEMQHLDFAYASSIIRTFTEDPSLVLTIRGRKYTPGFEFRVGKNLIETRSVQTEVDAGYEGKEKIVLIEAKNKVCSNTIIRQLYYPYRQWQEHSNKKVYTLFFEKSGDGVYSVWEFEFKDKNDYNSINLVKSARYKLI